MQSPFRFGKLVEEQQFVNRIDEQNKLKGNFESNINTIVISPRRIGKSSLVQKVATKVATASPQKKFVFLDLFYIKSEDEFYREYARAVVKATGTKAEEWMQTAMTFLGRLNPKISFGINDFQDISLELGFGKDASTIADILNLPEKIAQAKNIEIIVCLDEFQNCNDFTDPKAFLKRLRSIWQKHQRVCYCLYGSKKNMMTTLFQSTAQPFYRFGEIMWLSKISRAHWTQYIVSSFEQTGKSISPELADKIAESVQEHSYYVQQYAHLVWGMSENTATDEILVTALDELLSQNSLLYEREIQDLSQPQLNYLRALCDGIQKLSSQDVLQKYRLTSSANVAKIKKSLENRDFIDVAKDGINIQDPVFEIWLKKSVFI